jgi:hypothetical protein
MSHVMTSPVDAVTIRTASPSHCPHCGEGRAGSVRRFLMVDLLPTVLPVVLITTLLASETKRMIHIGSSSVGLLVALASGTLLVSLIAQPFQPSLVRMLEGYWDAHALGQPFARIGTALQRRRRRRLLSVMETEPLTPKQLRDRERAIALLERYPDEHRLLPTRLGNILRAAEDGAGQRYGLETVTMWPRLFPNVGARLAIAIMETQDHLDMCVRLCLSLGLTAIISAVLLLTEGWLLVVPAATGLLAWTCYQAATRAAENYGDAMHVAFDLHRFDMLSALHCPLPDDLETEQSYNEALSGFFAVHEPIGGDETSHAYEHPGGQPALQGNLARLVTAKPNGSSSHGDERASQP